MFTHPDLRRWLPSERLVAGNDSGSFVFDQRAVTKALRDIGPFAFMEDVGMAKNTSRAIALVLLFLGGLGLGRYAGYGSWRAGFIMAAIGTLLVGAIKVLGG